jgi:hypothetical protein
VSPRWRCGIDEKVEVLLTAELSARRVAQTTRKRVRDTQMLSNKTSPGQEASNLALFAFVSDFIATEHLAKFTDSSAKMDLVVGATFSLDTR